MTRHLHTWWKRNAQWIYSLQIRQRKKSGWNKKKQSAIGWCSRVYVWVSISRHAIRCDIFFIQYIQKPLTSSNVKSLHKRNSPEKSGFFISFTLPITLPHALSAIASHHLFRNSRSLCYFGFKKICLENFSVHLCLYKIQHLLNVNKCTKKVKKKFGCMNLKRCVLKRWRIFNFILCACVCVVVVFSFSLCQCLQFTSAHKH